MDGLANKIPPTENYEENKGQSGSCYKRNDDQVPNQSH